MLKERIQVSKNFFLDEFLPPQLYHNIVGDKTKAFVKLLAEDERKFYKLIPNEAKLRKLINIAQYVRDRYNKAIFINTWGIGGNRINSGFREKDSEVGAANSAHKSMEAIDFVSPSLKEGAIFYDIIKNQEEFYNVGITEIEEGTFNKATLEGWIHLSIRKTKAKSLTILPYYK